VAGRRRRVRQHCSDDGSRGAGRTQSGHAEGGSGHRRVESSDGDGAQPQSRRAEREQRRRQGHREGLPPQRRVGDAGYNGPQPEPGRHGHQPVDPSAVDGQDGCREQSDGQRRQ